MPATLDEIGLKFGTDKASSHHDYLSFYERFLAPLRDEPITVLEIGVFRGASLKTWREYFPNAKIIGVDIQLTTKQLESDRIKIELADQSNLEHLAQIALAHGPFDLIIEDGSHMWEHQITTLRALFPFLKNGGHYIVEDLQTNYGAMQAKYRGKATESCTTFLKRWMDLLVAESLIELDTIEDPFLRTYGRAIEFMTFQRRACLIKKRLPATDWRVSSGPPLTPRPADALMVVVNAHFGMRGDIFGPNGFVDEGADLYTIQGFALESEIAAVEYRVRFPDGVWSEWVGEGVFAGTRGHAIALTGLSARIVDNLKDSFDLSVHGQFVGGVEADAAAGEDCVAPTGASLRGLQVTISRSKARIESSAAEAVGDAAQEIAGESPVTAEEPAALTSEPERLPK